MTTRLKMKELERLTGVGRETIRFYIREGLLPEPERPGRNVAWYDEAFVARVRCIKELQEKRYLPLAVIKRIVAGETPPSLAEVDAILALEGRLAPPAPAGMTAEPERLASVAKRTGLGPKEIRAIADTELFEIEVRGGDQWLAPAAVRMLELWARLRGAGFTDALGFGPEQARFFVDAIRMLARDELRIFARAITGRVGIDQAARMAEEGIAAIGELLPILHRETLLRFVAEGNLPAAEEAAPRGRRRASHAS